MKQQLITKRFFSILLMLVLTSSLVTNIAFAETLTSSDASESVSASQSISESQSEPESQSVSEPQSEPESQSVSESQSESEPQSEPEAQSVPENALLRKGLQRAAPDDYLVHFLSLETGAEYAASLVVTGQFCLEQPGPSVMPAGKVGFWGWYTKQAIDDAAAAGKELPDEADAFDFAGTPITQELNLYAVFSTKYIVQFKNVAGAVVRSQLVEVGGKATAPTDLVLDPTASGVFSGNWVLEGDASGTPYDFDTVVMGNLVLLPIYTDQFYVQFVTNGSPVSPQVVNKDDFVTLPANPTRPGYTFLHWATTDGGTIPFNAVTQPITDNLTLYAVWQGEMVNYQVMYWLEKPNIPIATMDPNNPDNYACMYFETQTGTAGDSVPTTVETVPAAGQMEMLQQRVSATPQPQDPAPNTYATFHHSNVSQVVIEGDGSTIVNVYYTRDIYTLNFELRVHLRSPATTAISAPVQWRMNGNAFQTITGVTRIQSVQVKVGMQLDASNFPYPLAENGDRNFISGTSTTYTMRGWGPYSIGTPTEFSAIYLSTRSGTTPTYADAYDDGTKTATYLSTWVRDKQHETIAYNFVESLDQDPSTAATVPTLTTDLADAQVNRLFITSLGTANVSTSVGVMNPLSSNLVYDLYSQGRPYFATTGDRQITAGLEGFTFVVTDKTSGANINVRNCFQWDTSVAAFRQLKQSGNANANRRYFFFLRNSYQLTFDGGLYSTALSSLLAAQSIKYEADFSANLPKEADINQALPTGVSFDGWYLDEAYQLPYDTNGTQMPARNLQLFAKFKTETYTVRYFDDVSVDVTDPANVLRSVNVQSTQKVVDPGIYTVGQVYPQGTFLGWVQVVQSNVINYHFNGYTTQNLDLFAKWETEKYTLTYDLDGGTGAPLPVDTTQYETGTKAAVANVTGLTKQVGAETWLFAGWQKQGTTEVYYPGMTVLITANTTLVARYLAPAARYNTIVYHQNASATDTRVVSIPYATTATTPVEDHIALTFENTTSNFLGWSTDKNATMGDTRFTPGTTIQLAGNLDLYAVWGAPMQITLSAEKSLNGGVPALERFSFTLKDTAANILQTKQNNSAGAVAFDTIIYNAVGVYTYEIAEVDGGVAGVVYDTAKYIARVTVSQTNGVFDIALEYQNADTLQPVNSVTFANTSVPVTVALNARKTLNNQAPGSEVFRFQLTDLLGNVLQEKENDSAGDIVFNAVTYSAPGVYSYLMKELAGSDANMQYDGTVYQAVVTITQINGAYQTQVEYSRNGMPVSSAAVIFQNIRNDSPSSSSDSPSSSSDSPSSSSDSPSSSSDSPSSSSQAPVVPPSNGPQTGDTQSVFIAIALAAMTLSGIGSVALIVYLILVQKKKKQNKA